MPIKKAYLTIDDAPSKDFRNKVDFLSNKNIPAIFFCWGENMAKYEEDLIYAIQKGFILGNHSWSHPHFSDLTLDECKQEIKSTDIVLDRVYQKSQIERAAKFFRFPYFDCGGSQKNSEIEKTTSKFVGENLFNSNEDKRKELQIYLQGLGYRQPNFQGITLNWVAESMLLHCFDIGCTFDQMEYWLDKPNAPFGLNKAETILARIDENYPEQGRALNDFRTTDIILIHDHNPDESVALFYKIIQRYQEKGICFLGVV
jgi:peptidoglycan-N-acetylglucosamine deacetylase